MKIAQKKYTHSVKLSTLRILQKNDFNYLKTEKSTGVSRSTIKKWQNNLGPKVFSGKSPSEEALAKIDAEMQFNDISIIRSLYTLRKGTLLRVVAIAEKETKLESLLNVLKYVSGELQKFNDCEKTEPDTAIDYVAYITKIMFGSKEDQIRTNDLDK
jgi:hypothetical protein